MPEPPLISEHLAIPVAQLLEQVFQFRTCFRRKPNIEHRIAFTENLRQHPLGIGARKLEPVGRRLTGEFLHLTPIKQPSGKIVHAWAVEMDCDPTRIMSNTFVFRGREYPEVDRAAWFTIPEARRKILKGQLGFLDELDNRL